MVEDKFDPTSNHVIRWVVLYALPLALLTICLSNGWVGLHREFLVPLLWGAIVPAYNASRAGGRMWAFRDFQNRDYFPLTMPLYFPLVWSIAVNATASAAHAAICFGAFFFAFDTILFRARVLRMHFAPTFVVRRGRGALGVYHILSFLLAWTHLPALFWAAQVWGNDTPGSILLWTAICILPMQIGLSLVHWVALPAERFENIKRVAVIGGGWSGIYAVKWLSELGLVPVAFESSDALCGTWTYGEKRPGVMESTRTTASKHFLHASDFAFPSEVPMFPHHRSVREYLERYVDHFDIRSCYRLETAVTSVSKQAGQGWRVQARDRDGKERTETFDAVVVCSGAVGRPRIDVPTEPLYGRFEGPVVHAAQYKHNRDLLPGERVLVVGGGESASDIVMECTQAGASVHWSNRSGQWFADRHLGANPADLGTNPGYRVMLGRFLNFEYVQRGIVSYVLQTAWGPGGHGIAPWIPTAPFRHQFVNKSRDAILQVYYGHVRAHAGVVAIDGHTVTFQGEEEPGEFDRLILATGYYPHFPFLASPPSTLYKKVFDVADATLAFVGLARPTIGSIPSLSELQARWIANVYSGKVSLPHPTRRAVVHTWDMEDEVTLFRDSTALRTLCDQEVYSSEIASYVGADVRWLRLLLTWPSAFWAVLRAPWLPFKFRLGDPDPKIRTESLRRIQQAMAAPTHPLNAFFYATLVSCLVVLVGLGMALFTLPLAVVTGGLAAFVTAYAIACRLVDHYRVWVLRGYKTALATRARAKTSPALMPEARSDPRRTATTASS